MRPRIMFGFCVEHGNGKIYAPMAIQYETDGPWELLFGQCLIGIRRD